MGYSGFGMQKWIFTQKPRKPFSRNKGANASNSIFSKTFGFLSGSYSKKQALENISKRKTKIFGITSAIVFFFTAGTFFFVRNIKSYSNVKLEYSQEVLKETDQESYHILTELGDQYFKNEEYLFAANEFELAYKLKPNPNLKEKILNCYQYLCETDTVYCSQFYTFLNEK